MLNLEIEKRPKSCASAQPKTLEYALSKTHVRHIAVIGGYSLGLHHCGAKITGYDNKLTITTVLPGHKQEARTFWTCSLIRNLHWLINFNDFCMSLKPDMSHFILNNKSPPQKTNHTTLIDSAECIRINQFVEAYKTCWAIQRLLSRFCMTTLSLSKQILSNTNLYQKVEKSPMLNQIQTTRRGRGW